MIAGVVNVQDAFLHLSQAILIKVTHPTERGRASDRDQMNVLTKQHRIAETAKR
jgi:hypothetical protein